MHIGQVLKRDVVKNALRPGYGIATVVVDDTLVRIGGEPKPMAKQCHEVADNVVGLKVAKPDCITEVIVNGGTICNRSECSVLCQNCPGLN